MAGRFSDLSPASSAFDVTPSDATIFSTVRGLYVGTTGDVAVRMAGGQSVVFQNVPVGMLPVQVTQVLSTGTTASDIIGLR